MFPEKNTLKEKTSLKVLCNTSRVHRHFVTAHVCFLLIYKQGFPMGPEKKQFTCQSVILNISKHSLSLKN